MTYRENAYQGDVKSERDTYVPMAELLVPTKWLHWHIQALANWRHATERVAKATTSQNQAHAEHERILAMDMDTPVYFDKLGAAYVERERTSRVLARERRALSAADADRRIAWTALQSAIDKAIDQYVDPYVGEANAKAKASGG